MNGLDFSILGILLLLSYRGYKKGFIQGITSVFAIGLGFYGGLEFYLVVGKMVKGWIDIQGLENVLSFVILFIIIHFGVHWIGQSVQEFLTKIYLAWLDNTLGGVLGLFKGFLIAGLILWVLSYLDIMVLRESIRESDLSRFIGKIFGQGLELLIQEIPNEMKDKGKDLSKKFYSF